VTETEGPLFLRQEVRAENGYAYGAIGADIHVFGNGTPVYLLFAHRGPAGDLDDGWLRAQPSRMLDARAEVVDFIGRDTELGDLIAWREQSDGMAVRWLHGAGGQGKTRLAARLAADSEAAGWKVVTAVLGTDTAPPAESSQDLRLDGHTGVLVLVDYADRWPASHLSWLFHNRLLRQGVPARILLLGRSAHGWPVVRAQLNRLRENIDTSDQFLCSLPAQGDERERMFVTARDCFAARYPEVPDAASIAPLAPLGQDDFGLTLAVQMAALVAVDARAHGRRPPDDMVGLTAYLLDREHENWRQLHENAAAGMPYRTPDHLMKRTVFTAVLTGPVIRRLGRDVLGRLVPEMAADELLDDHAICYPPADPARAHVLEPLLPDRLAEDFLALTLPGSPVTGYATDPWAASGTTALLARDKDGAAAPWTARAVTFLAEAAGRWPHVGKRHLFPVLKEDPRLALDAGNVALFQLADLDDPDPEVLDAIETAIVTGLGHERHIDLDAGVAAITLSRTAHHAGTTTDPVVHANLGLTLSRRMAHAGDHVFALTIAESVVNIMRERFDRRRRWRRRRNSSEAKANLAVALGNLGNRLGEADRWDEALAAGEEALGLFRQLAATSDSYNDAVAVTQGNVATCLSRLGRFAEALTHVEESMEIVRRLAEADPDTYTADFARGLVNVGATLSENGKHAEALAATTEAVAVWRRLAAEAPHAYLPDLAMALANHGRFLRHNRGESEALAATQEATAIRRRMAGANQRAHGADLGQLLSELGRAGTHRVWPEDSWAVAEEAVEVQRRLAESDPDRHLADFARALYDLATLRSGVDHPEQRLAAAEEATSIYRRLAETAPDAHRARLADALRCLSGLRADLARHERALALFDEAVASRPQARTGEDGEPFMLAVPTTGPGGPLSAPVARRDAVRAAEEAVDAQRRLVDARPGLLPVRADLASALLTLSAARAAAGDADQALAAADEAVELLGIRDDNHSSLLPRLLHARSHRGSLRAGLGQWHEGVLESGTAVSSFHTLARRDPGRHTADLAEALAALRAVLDRLSGRPDARGLIDNAVAACRHLAAQDPDAGKPWLASLLLAQARIHARTKEDRPQALVQARGVVSVFGRLDTELPGAFTAEHAFARDTMADLDPVWRAATEAPPRLISGCDACYGEDAESVWQRVPDGYDRHEFLDEDSSHFSATLCHCRACSQTFVKIFTEFIDWSGGNDAQYFTLMPVSAVEAAALTEGTLDVFSLGLLGNDRRHLHMDFPTGAEQPRIYWATGYFQVIDGD
jgi:tetratricopeptide (TPR) repeat protein